MRVNKLLVSGILMMGLTPVFAQDTAAVKKTETAKIKSYADLINAKTISKSGLFTVHKQEDKYFFEIPDTLLNREILFTTRLVKVPAGSPRFGGELVNSIIVSFEKATDTKLYMRVPTMVAVADSSETISKAVHNASVNPIVMVMDVKARGKENKSSLIEVTDFILKDNSITGFSPEAKKGMYVSASAADRSFIVSVNPCEQNIEIKTVKTFSMGGGVTSGGEGEGGGAASASVGVTMELSTSIMLLPKTPMTPRYADPRVGFYKENYIVFADDQQKVEERNFIVRQRLEPKTEDLERYKRGELVEPATPIVYYVDPATPKQWVPYIIAGVNDWNEAFKAAGFKNAITAKEWTGNDSTMSLEDARYKVIRYFPSEQAFSYAPRVYDPRSGEIVQSYIGWSHNKLQSLHDWYFIQAAATDPRARSVKFSNELMGSLIRAAICREVGTSLGLRPNLAASNAMPTEKLRDKKWVEANGFSASIMDLIHYNYVAQPGDNISPNGLIPQIGEYDKWAIKFGYTYTGINDFEAEKKQVQQWVLTAKGATNSLQYSTELSPNPNDPADPRAQTEDLGNDPVKASEYGLKNLKIVMANLLAWTKEDMDMYDNAAAAYDNVCDWYGMLIRHVYSQLGGVSENLKSVEQAGDVYTLVPKAAQKQAVAFLQKEVFQTPSWLFDASVLNKIRRPVRKEMIQRIQENALYYCTNSTHLYRMTMETMRYGKDKTYTVDELLTDMTAGLWSELRTNPVIITTSRRSMQKAFIDHLFVVLKDAGKKPEPTSTMPDLTNTDIPAVVRMHLEKIAQQCKANLPFCTDAMTLAHLKYVSEKITSILHPKN
ncbi:MULTISPECIES: zinc-dependent metalloprotease [Niastella]|uniref:Zinc-dependent metalloprotease n=1 Tax=Niastella soli TaxID=2821487 RepID=A0ABS3Z5L5_9BACT|nr:zinc-dependent metalloprotease [Niastella soli]MBO9204701.1 zinc-dependent metalloprotease [Niastella soli]